MAIKLVTICTIPWYPHEDFPHFPSFSQGFGSIRQVRAGGRIPLIIGRGLTNRAREAMSLGPTTTFKQMAQPEVNVKGFSLAQKMVGKAVGWMVEAKKWLEVMSTLW